MLLIARGRAEGLNCFRDTPQAFLLSLAPALGIVFASLIEGFAEGAPARAFVELPGTLCVLLAPAVLSFEMARFWGREAFWGRYIVAFNWCQWLLPTLALGLVAAFHVATLGGANEAAGLRVLVVCLACYALWLNWFLARHGLALTPWRAAGLVATVNLGTVALVLVPTLLATLLK